VNSGTGNWDERPQVLELRGGREDVRAGRRFLTDALIRLGWEERADDASLLLSELLANVALHARTSCLVKISATADRLRVEVEDRSPVLPRVQHFAIDTTTGRGLQLVDRVAESWGAEPTTRGKRVWFCLDRHSSGDVTDASGEADIDALLDGWASWDDPDSASVSSKSEPPR
jgi:anti-sigma regulatory factor (Ser/Thr protein kinase)